MCGRASIVTNPRAIAKELLADLDPGAEEGWQKHYNFAPTQQAVIVVPGGDNGRLVEPATWGWKRTVGPPKERGKAREKLVINAMAETAADKPMFRQAMAERRAVLPVTGYYEWFGPPKDRRPVHFTAANGELLLLAILYAEEEDAELPAFTILTTSANRATRGIHDRMPVIIPHRKLDQWLQQGGGQLLAPAPNSLLAAREVSQLLNNAQNEGAALWRTDGEEDEALQAALRLLPQPKGSG